jgi:hypothetical protein
MKLNLRTQSLGITLVILLLLPGCLSFSGYGRITPLEEGTTIQDLATDWKAFHVTYCGVRPERPLGVMFDPKDDPYSLTGKSWKSIRDSGGLERTLMWLEATDRHPPAPRLWRIVGPEGQFFGYLYTGNEPVVMRSIDEHTLYVMELTEPHIKNMRENAGPF